MLISLRQPMAVFFLWYDTTHTLQCQGKGPSKIKIEELIQLIINEDFYFHTNNIDIINQYYWQTNTIRIFFVKNQLLII